MAHPIGTRNELAIDFLSRVVSPYADIAGSDTTNVDIPPIQ